MKILFFNLVSEKEIGVQKKIYYQIKALQKSNNVVSTKITKYNFYIEDKFIGKIESNFSFLDKILKKLYLYYILKKIQDKKYFINVEVVYIRYFFTSPWTISYFKFLKEMGIKIILEIPTYPYDQEIQKENFFTRWDKKYRNELKKYVDKIVTYSEDEEIFGIPCINISNGIDLNEVKMIDKREKNKEIVFTSVSNCSFWHGIDRFLYSLVEYIKNNGTEKILFNIVGEGNENQKLKEKVNKNIELKKVVKFHGIKVKEELEKVYNQTDIGVGSLGIHRIGLKEVQPLKNREYCAKGLPFVISFKDPDFENREFVYKVSNDEEIFDIEKIIEWYKNLKTTPEEIREYSKKFTWDIQMKKVVECLREEK